MGTNVFGRGAGPSDSAATRGLRPVQDYEHDDESKNYLVNGTCLEMVEASVFSCLGHGRGLWGNGLREGDECE